VLNIPVNADGQFDEAAEIIANIDAPDYKIPAVRISEWTSINITVTDAFGINWTQLESVFPIRSRYIWPIIHPSWRPFLGYTSLRFEPEIIQGNPNGWRLRVTPNAIPQANSGRTYILNLEIQADDINIDYAVVVGIRAIRSSVYGEDIGDSYIYIPVKASALNNIKMQTTSTTIEAAPHSIVRFDATISNYGYYKDMFSIELRSENDLKILSPNQVIVLEPGSNQKISIDVLTPEKLFDPGTPNRIEVYIFSSGDPDAMHIGSLVVITKGVFISPLAFIIAAPIILVLLVILLFFIYIKDKQDREMYGKPDKPWLIPEEKRYLEKLKSEDKEKYSEVLSMMRDEYASSLLWYQSYKDSIKQNENKEAKGGFFGRLNHPLNKKDLKDDTPVKEENEAISQQEPSKKSFRLVEEEDKATEQPVKEQPSSSVRGLFKKLHLPQKQIKTDGDQAIECEHPTEPARQPQKESSFEPLNESSIEPPIDPEEQRRLQEQEEKKRKKDEALKKITKAQTKQKRKIKK
jgi:hypothetical protein